MKTIYKSSFLKAITKNTDKRLKMQVAQAILSVENAETTTDIQNLEKIKGFHDFYRIRIGQYRLGLKIEDDTIYFVAFAHRKDIYKLFP